MTDVINWRVLQVGPAQLTSLSNKAQVREGAGNFTVYVYHEDKVGHEVLDIRGCTAVDHPWTSVTERENTRGYSTG